MSIDHAAQDSSSGIWKATDIFDPPPHPDPVVNFTLMNFSGENYDNLIGITLTMDGAKVGSICIEQMAAGFRPFSIPFGRPTDYNIHSLRLRLWEHTPAGRVPQAVLREVDFLYQVQVPIL